MLSQLETAAALPLPELNADTDVATAGYYRLEWRLSAAGQHDGLQYMLQESPDSRFEQATILYQGPDLATVLSGRANGMRYYRVRAIREHQPVSQWSEPVGVETRHHTLARALMFFFVGAMVFVLTLILILRGSRVQGQRDAFAREPHDG